MVGGEAEDVAQAMPVLSAMGKSITHVGPSGAGQFTKAINQVIISGVYLAVAEGMTLGLKAGLDMEKVVQALAGGAAGSWVLNFRSGNMIRMNTRWASACGCTAKIWGSPSKLPRRWACSCPARRWWRRSKTA